MVAKERTISPESLLKSLCVISYKCFIGQAKANSNFSCGWGLRGSPRFGITSQGCPNQEAALWGRQGKSGLCFPKSKTALEYISPTGVTKPLTPGYTASPYFFLPFHNWPCPHEEMSCSFTFGWFSCICIHRLHTMILPLSCFAPLLLFGAQAEYQWKFREAEMHSDPLCWLQCRLKMGSKKPAHDL